MGLFITIVAGLVVLGGGVTFLAGVAGKGQDYSFGAKAGGIVAIALAGLLFFVGGIRSVPVKSVGVLTSFGHVEGDLTPGFHWEVPWKQANILSEAVQTTTFNGANCLQVRIGGQQTACLDATIQWQIKDSAAPQLFNDYDTSGGVEGQITTAVVVREFESVVNQVLGDYNPISDVSVNGQAGNSQFSTFGPQVLSTMRADIGTQINVIRVIMPLMHYDSSTQGRLNTIQQQYAEAAIAAEQIAVNQAQAKANAAIGTPSAAQLANECYSIVQSAMKTNYKLPATFNCGGTTAGVVVSGG